MDKKTIVRAWKDPEFRASLTGEQRAALPDSPSGKSITELDDSDLDGAVGGVPISIDFTVITPLCRVTRFYCPPPTRGYGRCPPLTYPL